MHPIELQKNVICPQDTKLVKGIEDLGPIEELPPSYEISEINILENQKEQIMIIEKEEENVTKINLNNLKDSYILLNIQHEELLNKIKKQELQGGHIKKRFSR